MRTWHAQGTGTTSGHDGHSEGFLRLDELAVEELEVRFVSAGVQRVPAQLDEIAFGCCRVIDHGNEACAWQ